MNLARDSEEEYNREYIKQYEIGEKIDKDNESKLMKNKMKFKEIKMYHEKPEENKQNSEYNFIKSNKIFAKNEIPIQLINLDKYKKLSFVKNEDENYLKLLFKKDEIFYLDDAREKNQEAINYLFGSNQNTQMAKILLEQSSQLGLNQN